MNWAERMNAVIGRIEEDLTGDVHIQELAEMVCMSPYHFQTLFACMTDMPLGEYVRRRRMSCAAAELQNGAKVLDTALRYGYQSPTAFNRAFRQVHGIAPSEAQKKGAKLKSYPPLHFQITVKGAEEMNYRIETKEAFTALVKKRLFSLEGCFDAVPKFWEEYCAAPPAVTGCLGICEDPSDGSGAFAYMIGDKCEPDAPIPEGYERVTIPAFTWAVFEAEGQLPEDLQKLNRRIFTEWLPGNAEYSMAAGWNIEAYDMEPSDGGASRFALWIPVKRKEG